MGRVPDAVLIVEDVILHAAARGRTPGADEMLHPGLLIIRVGKGVRVARSVDDVLPIRLQNAVASVRKPLPVIAGLRSVLGYGKARQLGAVRAEPGQPADDRDGQHGLGARVPGHGEKCVAALAGDRARLADAFEIPVLPAIIGVDLPIVTCGVVAAVAIEGTVQVWECGRSPIGDAIYVWVDRSTVRI